ncbi:MAG: hypothetical protein ACPKPY_09985 [Nitrososphaeraceae archaeon]
MFVPIMHLQYEVSFERDIPNPASVVNEQDKVLCCTYQIINTLSK